MPAQLAVEMTADEVKFFRGVQKLIGQQAKLEGGLTKTGKAGQAASKKIETGFNKSSDTIGGKMLPTIAGVGLGLAAVGKGMEAIVGHSAKWADNMKRVATETRKAQQDIVAFAALQAGGTKRAAALKTSKLAAKFGVTDRGQAFDTVQSLQSALGSLQAGLAASATVFAGSNVGLPIELGKELETIGAALKLEPGVASRQAFVSGQLTGRSPVEVAQAAKGLPFFKGSSAQGFAAAGIISEVAGKETGTVFRATGLALSESASPEFRKSLRGLGVPKEANAFERLQALRKAGITTPEQLSGIGLKEINQASGVSALLQDLPRLQALTATIKAKATPGLFLRERAALEAEFPEAASDLRQRQFAVRRSNERAFGDEAQLAGREAEGRAVIGRAFEKIGLRDRYLPFTDTVDPEGRATNFGVGFAKLALGTPDALRSDLQDRLVEAITELVVETRKLSATNAETNGALRGGGGVVGPPQPASGAQGEQ